MVCHDPVRDRVLVVEQFRMGPYARGDRHPWQLEPIAGRIDGGESAEQEEGQTTRIEWQGGPIRVAVIGRPNALLQADPSLHWRSNRCRYTSYRETSLPL